ncbi:MAG: DUF448 domain-containing protein, partial [Eubacteriaceae bacterium]
GTYLCKSEICIDQFTNKNFLERSFKRKIDPEVIQKIRDEIAKNI